MASFSWDASFIRVADNVGRANGIFDAVQDGVGYRQRVGRTTSARRSGSDRALSKRSGAATFGDMPDVTAPQYVCADVVGVRGRNLGLTARLRRSACCEASAPLSRGPGPGHSSGSASSFNASAILSRSACRSITPGRIPEACQISVVSPKSVRKCSSLFTGSRSSWSTCRIVMICVASRMNVWALMASGEDDGPQTIQFATSCRSRPNPPARIGGSPSSGLISVASGKFRT